MCHVSVCQCSIHAVLQACPGLLRGVGGGGGEGGGDMKPGLNGSSVQQHHQHLVVD